MKSFFIPKLYNIIEPTNNKYIVGCTIKYKETMDLLRKFYFLNEININGFVININDIRIQTFKKYSYCVCCEARPIYFRIEKLPNTKNKFGRFHLNLYGINIDNEIVLMTRDHNIPKSKGGSELLSNMQTMCIDCNNKKGNILEEVL